MKEIKRENNSGGESRGNIHVCNVETTLDRHIREISELRESVKENWVSDNATYSVIVQKYHDDFGGINVIVRQDRDVSPGSYPDMIVWSGMTRDKAEKMRRIWRKFIIKNKL